MLKDAFPDSSTTLMVGSPGIGMLEVTASIAKEWMEAGDQVVFVSVDLLPKDLIEVMDAFGVSEELRNDRLCIIDYHSSLLGSMDCNDPCPGTDVKRCSDLEGIMFNISSLASSSEGRLRIVMHSLSTLFLYNQANVVLKFFQISSSRIRNEGGTAIFTVNEGVHDEKTVNHLMAISDGVMELKFDEDLQRRMRIRNMRGCVTSSKWTPFDIRRME
ncbi:hypothetical protein AOA80_10295 [Methanomassiliicoccales archaeon RumEn M1]|nr:hypothetical protein AOA80_10295 [Methanomassiliicoccales archaeon RumEn M1]